MQLSAILMFYLSVVCDENAKWHHCLTGFSHLCACLRCAGLNLGQLVGNWDMVPDESQGKPNCIKMAGDSQVLLSVWLGQGTAMRTGAVSRKGCNWMCFGQMIYLLSV